MSELKPLEERIKNLTIGLLGMADGETMQVNKSFLEHVRADMVELSKLRRAQSANDHFVDVNKMVEQAAQDMDDKCRQWQCVLQRVHDAGTFDQNSGLWVGIDKERETKAQASFEAYRYALEVIDKIAEHVSNSYKPANEPLTIEQLKQMDGEPVWLVHNEKFGLWTILRSFVVGPCATSVYNVRYYFKDYGKTWLAYRRPPERSENDA